MCMYSVHCRVIVYNGSEFYQKTNFIVFVFLFFVRFHFLILFSIMLAIKPKILILNETKIFKKKSKTSMKNRKNSNNQKNQRKEKKRPPRILLNRLKNMFLRNVPTNRAAVWAQKIQILSTRVKKKKKYIKPQTLKVALRPSGVLLVLSLFLFFHFFIATLGVATLTLQTREVWLVRRCRDRQ